MNPTLHQSIVDEALAEDLQAAKSEYLGEFRDDVKIFLPREAIEMCVIKNRSELLPRKHEKYYAFVDVSGGRHDDAALSIAHREGRRVIIDCVHRYKSPHDPHAIVGQMCTILRSYGCNKCVGDAYAAEWTRTTFAALGIEYWRRGQQEASS